MSNSEENLSSSIVYDELARLLSSHSSLTGPAECHGIIAGVVVAMGEQDPGVWVQHIMGDSANAEEPSVAVMLRVLDGLRKHVAMQLGATDMTFQLCVPDDQVALVARAGSLVEWCEGFLFGVGLAEGLDIRSLSSEAQEFITDLREITRLHIDVDETTEEDEVNYTELYEYVRMGVHIIHDELHTKSGPDNGVVH